MDDKKAYVRRVNVGYYTDADLTTSLKVLDEFDRVPTGSLTRSRGEVLVSSIVTLFKKIRFDTHENLGWGPVTLPELEMQTTAAWWTLPEWLETDYEREPVKNAMVGLAHILRHIAPHVPDVFCAGRPRGLPRARPPSRAAPTIYLYDSIPDGVGLSERVFEMDKELFRQAREVLAACPCENGCPSCVGATAGEGAKATLLSVLDRMWGSRERFTRLYG